MIIKFPTAQYIPILPNGPQDPGNYTFTISSNDPPRPTATGLPLQLGGLKQPLPERKIPNDRLITQGEYLFTVAINSNVSVLDGKKVYEVGQFLEFSDETEIIDISLPNYPEIVEIQHNTNILNLTSVLTQEESDALISEAKVKFNSYIKLLNELKSEILKIETDIKDNQRNYNEALKIKSSAQIVFASDPIIIEKLDNRINELISQREDLVESLNSKTAEADEIYKQIIILKEVVR